jgi:hypothetical protein
LDHRGLSSYINLRFPVEIQLDSCRRTVVSNFVYSNVRTRCIKSFPRLGQFKEIAGANLDDFSGDDLRPIFKRAADLNVSRPSNSPDSNPLVRLWADDQALDMEVNHSLPAA